MSEVRRGRPRKELDAAQVMKLAAMGCTEEEIADFFGVSPDTIARRKEEPDFAEALKMGRAALKISLRRLQWQSAARGSTTMQIWLGKQLLGQSDKVEDTTPMKVAEDLVLPTPLSREEYAVVQRMLAERNALPGGGDVN